MKYRDKLSRLMAGLDLARGVFDDRRITKAGEHSNPVFRSFIASFGVALIRKRPDLQDPASSHIGLSVVNMRK